MRSDQALRGSGISSSFASKRVAQRKKKSWRRGVIGSAAFAAAAMVTLDHASAATFVWKGSGTTANPGSGNWNTAGNWDPGTIPSSASTTELNFNDDAGGSVYTSTNDIGGTFQLNILKFNSADTTNTHVVAGNQLDFVADGITNPTIQQTNTGAYTVSAPLSFTAATTIQAVNGSSLNLSGALSGTSLTVTNTSGTGNANVTLAGSNNYTGGTTINARTTVNASIASLGSGTVNLNGGTLKFTGTPSAGGQQTLSLAASSYNEDIVYENDGSPSITANVDGGNALYEKGLAGGSLGVSVGGLIQSTATTSQGDGTHVVQPFFQLASYSSNNALRLTSSQSGTMTLNAPTKFDTISLFYTGSLVDGANVTATLNFSDGSTTNKVWAVQDWFGGSPASSMGYKLGMRNNVGSYLDFGYATQVDFTLSAADKLKTLNSITFSTPSGVGTSFDMLAISGYVNTSSSLPGNALNVTADSTIDVGSFTGGVMGTLTIGSNKLSLAATNASSLPYSLTLGATTLNGGSGGTTSFDVATSTGGGAGTLSLGGLIVSNTNQTLAKSGAGTLVLTGSATGGSNLSAVNVAGGTLVTSSTTAIGTTANVSLSASTTWSTSGVLQTIGGLLSSSSSSSVQNSTTLTIGSNNSSGTFAGVISGGGMIVKIGTGTQGLSGASTYSIGTTIYDGTIVLGSSTTGAITNGPVGTGQVKMGDGVSANNTALLLDATAGRSVANTIAVQTGGSGTATIGGLNTSGASTFTGNITLGSGSGGHDVILGAANGGQVNFTGNIVRNASSTAAVSTTNLSGSGTGTVRVTGVNNYTGGTTVNANTVLASGLTASTSTMGTGAVTLAGGTLRLEGQQTTTIGSQQALGLSGFNDSAIIDATSTFSTQGPSSWGNAKPIDTGSALVVNGYTRAGDFSPVTGGLPASGSFVSALDSSVTFQFEPYEQQNTLYFSTSNFGTPKTLTLDTPQKFSKLQFLADAQASGVTFNVVLNFSDSSTSSFAGAVSTGQWAFGTAPSNTALTGGGSGQVVSVGGGTINGGWPWFLTQSSLNLSGADQLKTLQSVTFYSNGLNAGSSAEIFAISGLSVGSTVTAATQTYANNVVVTQDSGVDISGSLDAVVGGLSIGSNVLSVTSSDATSSPYSLTTGAATFTGSPTFNIANSTGGGQGTLNLPSINATAPNTTLTKDGAGILFITGAATGTTSNLTHVQINAGQLWSYNGTALGSVADVSMSPGSGTALFRAGATQTIGALNSSGAGTSQVFISSGETLTIGNSNHDGSFGGSINGGGGSGLTKIGTGTQALGGSLDYQGPTTVNGGTLLINGTLSANGSTVTVNSGGTLGGSGTIARATTINSGGTLAPGNSIGQIDQGDTTLTLGGLSDFEISKTAGPTLANDRMYSISTLSYGGTLSVSLASGSLGVGSFAAGDSWDLFDFSSRSGTFASTSLPSLGSGLAWDFDYDTGVLSILSTGVSNFVVPSATDIYVLKGGTATSVIDTTNNGTVAGAFTASDGGSADISVSPTSGPSVGPGDSSPITITTTNTADYGTQNATVTVTPNDGTNHQTAVTVVVGDAVAERAANDRVTFGTALTGNIGSGGSYAGLSSRALVDNGGAGSPTLNTVATILGGDSASGDTTVSMAWRTRNTNEVHGSETLGSLTAGLASDVVNLEGIAHVDGGGTYHGSFETDKFVLQMTYDEAAIESITGMSEEAAAFAGLISLGYLDLGEDGVAGGGDDVWRLAVEGNFDPTTHLHGYASTFEGNVAWNASFMDLGDWGVDTDNNVVWAVLNHNSQFAAIPEPSSLSLLGAGAAVLLGRRRRRSRTR